MVWPKGRSAPATAMRRGFSLAEILVVLFILALGSTIALYSYSNYRKSLSVQTSARKFQAVLMQARSRAINLNLPHEVIVDLDKDTFWVNQLNATRTETVPKVVPEEAVSEFVRIDRLQIGSNTYTTGTHAIPFEPEGKNPYILMLLIREFDDPSQDENYLTVRLFPSSDDPKIDPKTRL